MTWAPASASRDEQNGAATACSTAMTVIPSSGSMSSVPVLTFVSYHSGHFTNVRTKGTLAKSIILVWLLTLTFLLQSRRETERNVSVATLGLNRNGACRAHARQCRTTPDWSRSAPPDRAASRGICVRHRILPQSRSRHGSARRHSLLPRKRPPPASWPCWLPRRNQARLHICGWLPGPSARQRASRHRISRSETGWLYFGRYGGRTRCAPWRRSRPSR